MLHVDQVYSDWTYHITTLPSCNNIYLIIIVSKTDHWIEAYFMYNTTQYNYFLSREKPLVMNAWDNYMQICRYPTRNTYMYNTI